ncbi:pyridoxal phosphate-dependent transferase [Lyophyllum atratum]|nr:pyridoxal phosphate-dependent transferase [Lyophyllum atratum]
MAPSSLPDSPLSDEFIIPTNKDIQAKLRSDGDSKITYLCGNSLGLPSKRSTTLVQEELNVWATRAVVGHFSHPHGRPWTKFTDELNPLMAELVGAKEKEVACMGTLTNNLHLMMDSFYKPTAERYKILCEARAFPSDQYAFVSQVRAHGLDPAKTILEEIIENEGSSIALVIFSGVQYYTGQWFPMEIITRKAKEQGCICGWDLAHAVGNVPISLHDWDVDFAVWCTYKYLNSSPGGIAGLYMHEKWNDTQRPKFAGWWGHELSTRFAMPPKFSPIVGAQGFQQSNPCIIALASLLGSLQVFKQAGMMGPIRERSLLLTGTLEKLLVKSKHFVPLSEPGFTIITPTDPSQRGAQLSLLFLPVGSGVMQKIFTALSDNGVIGDEREPDVIRLAAVPLYNTMHDCEQAVHYLEEAFKSIE